VPMAYHNYTTTRDPPIKRQCLSFEKCNRYSKIREAQRVSRRSWHCTPHHRCCASSNSVRTSIVSQSSEVSSSSPFRSRMQFSNDALLRSDVRRLSLIGPQMLCKTVRVSERSMVHCTKMPPLIRVHPCSRLRERVITPATRRGTRRD
jgi:hypothetical protein